MDHDHRHTDVHDQGLQFDLATLIQRRRLLTMMGGAAALVLVGCGDDKPTPSPTATKPGSTSTPAGTAAVTVTPVPTSATPASACTGPLPEETAGPYPGDGSNGPNALAQSGIVRKDIRSSFGTSTTVAQGLPLAIALTVVDTANQCKALAGAAVYLWHCDREGRYSMYSQGATNENYLRGIQVADSSGLVTFQSIFPGAYSGRWPHIHFEVYPSLGAATSSANKTATSQLALPEEVCNVVYATSGYEASVRNMQQTALARDNVFSDGYAQQMATLTGSVGSGYTASLLVGV